MPLRVEPFLNNNVYHVFNRTIDGKLLFNNTRNNTVFRETIRYYRSTKARVSFSKLKTMEKGERDTILEKVSFRKYFRVDILAHCFMPTHFHLLVEQRTDHGIPKFVSDVLNSFTRYYNIKNERKGPLLLPRFKAVRITTDEQLIHVSRYIHLNLYSSGIVEDFETLVQYEWSSFKDYVQKGAGYLGLVDGRRVLALFDKDSERYKNFVLSNAEHQRTLEHTKHTRAWR